SWSGVPSLAVDTTNGTFKDRLYAVWSDARSGRFEIYLSYSADKGKTWSRPRIVNDDRPNSARLAGPDHARPVVAVNRFGIIGVAWDDRRDTTDNLGWYERFSASLDGGETWQPSTRV